MLKKEVLTGLSKQIQHELTAEYAYLAISVWFERQALNGFADYFLKQAAEEHAHAMRILRYVQDRGGEAKLGPIEAPRQEFASALDALKHAQALERGNTAAINALYAIAVKADDLATQNHLQWFLKEQVEEEQWTDEFVAIAEKIDTNVGALFMFDHRVGKKAREEEDEEE